MLKISSVKLTRNWIIHNFTRKYQMRRLKQTERKSTNNWETASVSSIENLLIKWFRKIYSKNYSETVKKMLLTMMAMSNIYVNVRSTNDSNMNTKQIKDTTFQYKHFLITLSQVSSSNLSQNSNTHIFHIVENSDQNSDFRLNKDYVLFVNIIWI